MANNDRRPLKNYLEQVLIDHANSYSNGVERNTSSKGASKGAKN